MESIQALHAKVWTFRADMADVWPTPGPLDALRFATSESGEATSDYLRVVGGYARNNHHEPDVLGEAADCAMMLMTALGPDENYHAYWPLWEQYYDLGIAVDWLADWCGGLANKCAGKSNWRKSALSALATIDAMPGMDLAAELDKRLARIKAKHGGEA
jgi:hypothetical protein